MIDLRTCLVVAMLMLPVIPLAGQEEADAPEEPALSDETIEDVIKANRERRWTDVLQLTDRVPLDDPDYAGLLNLRLSALVQIKNYDEALTLLGFLEKMQKEVNADVTLFNYGEVHFVRGEYDQSEKYFSEFLALEGNELNALARFKLFLSYLLQGKSAEAEKMKAGIRSTISHPLFYYVNAAADFHAGREDEARDWLKSASNIYSLPLNVAFADTFKELGWLDPHEVTGFPTLTQAQLRSLNEEFHPAGPKRPRRKKGSVFESLLPQMNPEE